MNIKALIKKYEAVECVVGIVSGKTILKTVLKDLKQLDETRNRSCRRSSTLSQEHISTITRTARP